MPDPTFDELLSAYLDGETSPAERELVERLLESTDAVIAEETRRRLEALKRVSDVLRSLPHEPAPAELAPSIRLRAEREDLLASLPPAVPVEGTSVATSSANPPSAPRGEVVASPRPSSRLRSWGVILGSLAATAAAVALMMLPLEGNRIRRWFHGDAPDAKVAATSRADRGWIETPSSASLELSDPSHRISLEADGTAFEADSSLARHEPLEVAADAKFRSGGGVGRASVPAETLSNPAGRADDDFRSPAKRGGSAPPTAFSGGKVALQDRSGAGSASVFKDQKSENQSRSSNVPSAPGGVNSRPSNVSVANGNPAPGVVASAPGASAAEAKRKAPAPPIPEGVGLGSVANSVSAGPSPGVGGMGGGGNASFANGPLPQGNGGFIVPTRLGIGKIVPYFSNVEGKIAVIEMRVVDFDQSIGGFRVLLQKNGVEAIDAPLELAEVADPEGPARKSMSGSAPAASGARSFGNKASGGPSDGEDRPSGKPNAPKGSPPETVALPAKPPAGKTADLKSGNPKALEELPQVKTSPATAGTANAFGKEREATASERTSASPAQGNLRSGQSVAGGPISKEGAKVAEAGAAAPQMFVVYVDASPEQIISALEEMEAGGNSAALSVISEPVSLQVAEANGRVQDEPEAGTSPQPVDPSLKKAASAPANDKQTEALRVNRGLGERAARPGSVGYEALTPRQEQLVVDNLNRYYDAYGEASRSSGADNASSTSQKSLTASKDDSGTSRRTRPERPSPEVATSPAGERAAKKKGASEKASVESDVSREESTTKREVLAGRDRKQTTAAKDDRGDAVADRRNRSMADVDGRSLWFDLQSDGAALAEIPGEPLPAPRSIQFGFALPADDEVLPDAFGGQAGNAAANEARRSNADTNSNAVSDASARPTSAPPQAAVSASKPSSTSEGKPSETQGRPGPVRNDLNSQYLPRSGLDKLFRFTPPADRLGLAPAMKGQPGSGSGQEVAPQARGTSNDLAQTRPVKVLFVFQRVAPANEPAPTAVEPAAPK